MPIIYSYIDLDTSLTNNRFAAADINGWQFGYELQNNNAVSVQGLTLNRNIDLERSECLTSDGSCTDPNSVQYVGLGFVGYFGGVFKTFENLPPHCQIYFSAEVAVKGLEMSIGMIVVMIDSQPILVHTINPSNDLLFYEASTIQGLYSHSHSFLLFSFNSGMLSHEKTMGIRNIKIKYTPCPAGCLICSLADVQIQCSQWVLNYEGIRLNSQLLSNDGWQITNKKELFKTNQDLNTISYNYCLSIGLGPFKQNQDAMKTLFLDPHYEVRFTFYLITLVTETRLPPMIVVRIDGLEVHQLNIQSVGFQINFCQWESYDHGLREQKKVIANVDFTQKNTKRKITFSLRTQTITLQIKLTCLLYQSLLMKYFQKTFKSISRDVILNLTFLVMNVQALIRMTVYRKPKQQIFNKLLIKISPQVMDEQFYISIPELGGILTCNGRTYFGLDSTKVTSYQIQKFFTINDPHTEIEISFTIFKIDKYISEKFQIYLDEILIDQIQFSTIDYQYSFCGGADDDGQIVYTKVISHSRTLSLIQIKSTQTTTDGIFGIYNFKLKIKNGQESKDLFYDLSINPNLALNNWNQWMITQFSNDLNQYVCDSSVTLLVQMCQYYLQIRRFIQSIAIHTQIRIQFTMYLFTNKFDGKSLTLILNNQTIWEQNIIWYNQKACDASLDTFIAKGDIVIKKSFIFNRLVNEIKNHNISTSHHIIVDHELDYVFLMWSSNVQDVSASWGIADFKLFIS